MLILVSNFDEVIQFKFQNSYVTFFFRLMQKTRLVERHELVLS